MVAKLQEENRRLLKDQSPNHTTTVLSTTDGDILQRLKDSIEKQRDEIRLKEKLLQERSDDVDNVSKLYYEQNIYLILLESLILLIHSVNNTDAD